MINDSLFDVRKESDKYDKTIIRQSFDKNERK